MYIIPVEVCILLFVVSADCSYSTSALQSKSMMDALDHCPPGWFGYQSICYVYVAERGLTWAEATQRCQQRKATLLKLWHFEWTFIKNMLASMKGDTSRIWTALYRDDRGKWMWEEGEPQHFDPPYTLKKYIKDPGADLCATYQPKDKDLQDERCDSTDVDGFVCRRLMEVTYRPGLPWELPQGVNVTARLRHSYFHPAPEDQCNGRVTSHVVTDVITCAAKCVETLGCICFRYKCVASEMCEFVKCSVVLS